MILVKVSSGAWESEPDEDDTDEHENLEASDVLEVLDRLPPGSRLTIEAADPEELDEELDFDPFLDEDE